MCATIAGLCSTENDDWRLAADGVGVCLYVAPAFSFPCRRSSQKIMFTAITIENPRTVTATGIDFFFFPFDLCSIRSGDEVSNRNENTCKNRHATVTDRYDNVAVTYCVRVVDQSATRRDEVLIPRRSCGLRIAAIGKVR